MNTVKEGVPIAKIIGTKHVLYVSEEDPEESSLPLFTQIKLTDASQRFQLIPDKKKRFSLYIVGKNGCGKSFYIRQFLTEYVKVHPERKIRLFSSKPHDENLDDVFPQIKRVPIDNSFVDEPVHYMALERSLAIFDDIDSLPKKQRDAIYHLRDTILQNGRSAEIDIISTSHAPCGKVNQVPLNESDNITFFLRDYNRTIRYFLESYVGLDIEQIKMLRKIKTRAMTFCKTYPSILLSERFAAIVSSLVDE